MDQKFGRALAGQFSSVINGVAIKQWFQVKSSQIQDHLNHEDVNTRGQDTGNLRHPLFLYATSPQSLQPSGFRVAQLLKCQLKALKMHTLREREPPGSCSTFNNLALGVKQYHFLVILLVKAAKTQTSPLSKAASTSHCQKTTWDEIYNTSCHRGLVKLQTWHFREEFKSNHNTIFQKLG